jgi:hypothetical protein
MLFLYNFKATVSQPTVSSNLGGINIYLTLQSDYLHFFKDDVRLETGAD